MALIAPKAFVKWPLIFGLLLLFPALCYGYVVTIWHWKDRYRGQHTDLWGALILLETSGWMKIVYFFRHMLPDMRHTGRYRLPIERLINDVATPTGSRAEGPSHNS